MQARVVGEERPRFSLFRYLRRETSTGSFLPEIDGLRFVAIVSVVLFHVFMMTKISVHGDASAKPLLESIFGLGGRGVLLFFCISGFILGLPFARHQFAEGPAISRKAYFTRRLTRLEPPYLLNLFFRLPFAMAVRHFGVQEAVPRLLASVFYVHTLVYGTMPIIHPPSWSLEVEVQFYVLAPFVATAIYRQSAAVRRYGLVGLMVVATILQYAAGFAEASEGATRASFSILNFAQFFLAGLLAADCLHTVKPKVEADPRLDLVGVVALIAFFYTPNPLARFLLPFLGFAALWAALRSRHFKRFLSTPGVYLIGGMCYSLYLTHSFVLQLVFALMAKLSLVSSMGFAYVVGAAISLPAILVAGSIYYMLIERPCMDKNWPKKLAARLRTNSVRAGNDVREL